MLYRVIVPRHPLRLLTPILLSCAYIGLPSAQAQKPFTDISSTAGVGMTHTYIAVDDSISNGAAWLDFDLDGDLDLYMTQRVGANHLFRNNADGTFTDVAASVGADDPLHDGSGASVADYDNDGWPDLYLANADEDVLLRNVGGTFVDVTQTAFPDSYTLDARGITASWGDYDDDRFLDLYVANHKHLLDRDFDRQDRLFHNNGDGTFTDVSTLLGIEHITGFGFTGGWTDFDQDSDLDLYLINDCLQDGEPNKLFRNDGGTDWQAWTFTQVSHVVGAHDCENGMGLATGDYNHDGLQDYHFTNNMSSVLMQNTGGSLIDATFGAGLFVNMVPGSNRIWQTWGTNFFDYDLDGFIDLFMVAGSLHKPEEENPQPDRLHRNNGDGTFTYLSSSSGLDDPGLGRTSAFGDYDGDGDPDLFVVNYGGLAHLYRNDISNGNNWLVVDLEGVQSNRDGIGAKVKVRTPDDHVQTWEVRSGTSMGAGDDKAAYFGLGNQTSVSELEIDWPSGIVQRLSHVAANQRLRISEEATTLLWVTDPTGQALELGSTTTLEWTDNLSGDVQIELLKEGVQQHLITAQTESDGSYSWTIPTDLPVDADYTMRLTSLDFPDLTVSTGRFSIVPSSTYLLVTTPNGGESWEIGSTQTITWHDNFIGFVQIRLLKGGQIVQTLANAAIGIGTFSWTIASTLTPGDDYKIRITNTDNTSIRDESDLAFTLSGAAIPSLTVLTPNGGETLTMGTPYSITWNSSNLTGDVLIRLIKNGALVLKISTGTANDGEFTWNIPTTLTAGSDFTIRVTSLTNPTVTDDSDGMFTIQTAAAKAGATSPEAPATFALEQNYPNPFNPDTRIAYTLPEALPVRLTILDVLGRVVAIPVDAHQPAGTHALTWRAEHLPSGLYFYRLEAGSYQQMRSMLLAK